MTESCRNRRCTRCGGTVHTVKEDLLGRGGDADECAAGIVPVSTAPVDGVAGGGNTVRLNAARHKDDPRGLIYRGVKSVEPGLALRTKT